MENGKSQHRFTEVRDKYLNHCACGTEIKISSKYSLQKTKKHGNILPARKRKENHHGKFGFNIETDTG